MELRRKRIKKGLCALCGGPNASGQFTVCKHCLAKAQLGERGGRGRRVSGEGE